MRVTLTNYDSVHVELTHEEFRGLTGFQIGDHYGNHGASHKATINKVFNLKPAIDALYSCKQINETKETILRQLEDIKTKLKTSTFIVAEVSTIKDVEVKNEN